MLQRQFRETLVALKVAQVHSTLDLFVDGVRLIGEASRHHLQCSVF